MSFEAVRFRKSCLDEKEEFVAALEQMAKGDLAKPPGMALDGADGEELYPIRYDTCRVVRDIRDNKACPH